MSTNSTIAVKMSDNTYKAIYTHWDGYPEHNGYLLLNYYNSQEAAESLMGLGDLSCLDKSIECPPEHSYQNPVKGYSIAYGRDRGETKVEASTGTTYEEARKNKGEQQYNYFWNGEKWVLIIEGEETEITYEENESAE